MGPINGAYTPGLAVRAFIVGSGVGILLSGKRMCVKKFVTSSTQVDMQPLVTPWKSATSLKELLVE